MAVSARAAGTTSISKHEFVELVKALAWPLVVLVIVLLLSNEIRSLLKEMPRVVRRLRSVEPALAGIRKVVAGAVADMQANGQAPPTPLAEKHYSGEFRVRIPPHVHRALALEAAEQGISLNRLASAKLTG